MDVELRLALEEASSEAGVTLSSLLYPATLLWMGSADAASVSKLRKWLLSARRRTRLSSTRFSVGAGPQTDLVDKLNMMSILDAPQQAKSSMEPENTTASVLQSSHGLGLKERLDKAMELDINSPTFSWDTLLSLHHSEHASSTKGIEDDMSKPLELHDLETEDVSSTFQEACDFIDHSQKRGGKCLVHCFEGKSRSATVVLAYLMLRRNQTLLQAWNHLKVVHRRAQPNDGFMHALTVLDRQVHGVTSMNWQNKKPSLQVCPLCGKPSGLSASSLRQHLERVHRRYIGSHI